MADVSVIGLGMMGECIAETFLGRGREVAVWNRTPARADAVVDRGATLMDTAEEAIAASPIAIICVDSADTVGQLLDTVADASVAGGRTIVNLTSGSRDDATALEAKVSALGACYLDGHINVITDRIGKSDGILMYAGEAELFERHKELLFELGGGTMHVGEDVGAACMIAAGLSGFFHSAMLGFFEALAFARVVDLPLDQFAALADDRLSTLREYLISSVEVLATGDFDVRLSSVQVHLDGLGALIKTMEHAGSSTVLARQALSYLEQSVAAGDGALDLAATFKVMLPPPPPPSR